jgi:hypothetical protein
LKAGSKVEIVGSSGDWLQVRAGGREGWASAQYVAADSQPAASTTTAATAPATTGQTVFAAKNEVLNSLSNSLAGAATGGNAAVAARTTTGQALAGGGIGAHETRIEVAGYTAAYRGVRSQTRTGAFELAVDELDRLADPASAAAVTNVAYTEDGSTDNQGFRGQDKVHLAIERGTLLLEKGDLDQAVLAFEDAEETLKGRNQRSYSGDAVAEATSFVGSLFTGDGEFGPYNLQPYEEILFLNFKTIGYLLQGKSEAYNVGRRAADRQNELRAQFIDLIKQAKAEVEEEEKAQTDPEALSKIGAVRSW